MEPVLKVLIVEDEAWDARTTHETLHSITTRPLESRTCGTLGAAVQEAADFTPDILLLDLGLPDSRGLETLERARGVFPHSAIIVLTGQDDERIALQALDRGAHYYLLKKSMDAETLDGAIRLALQRRGLDEELRASRVARHVVRDLLKELFESSLIDRNMMRAAGQRMALRAGVQDTTMLERSFLEMGIGRIRVISEGSGRYAFEGEDMLERTSSSRMPTCHLALGFLIGYVSGRAQGGSAVGTEIECESRGDRRCMFVVHVRAAGLVGREPSSPN